MEKVVEKVEKTELSLTAESNNNQEEKMLKIVKKPKRFYRVLIKDAEGKLLGEDYASSFTEEAVLKKARKKYSHSVDLRVEPTTLRMVLLHLWGKTEKTKGRPFPSDDEFSIKEQLGLPPGFGEEEEVNRRRWFNPHVT